MHRVRAKQVVLATGALERPLVFAHNDIPGVMQASSVSTYINRFSVAPGNKLVLATSNDNAYRTAIDWHNAGREVVAIIDSRYSPNGDLVVKAESMGIKIYDGHGLIEARGGKCVKSALIAPLSIGGTEVIGAVSQLACDLIATSGGWSAAVHLSSHTGAKPVWDEEIVSFRPGDSKQQECSVGACKGTFDLHDGLVEGAIGGARAAHCAGFGDGTVKTSLPNVMQVGERPQQALFSPSH
jgi:sarcosine oxidase subunit alpha